MSDGPEIAGSPELYEAVLDEESLKRYIDDLLACASDLSLSVKAGPASLAAPEPGDIEGTIASLHRGDVRAVQVRYRFEGSSWCDTILRGSGGLRLLRGRLDCDGT